MSKEISITSARFARSSIWRPKRRKTLQKLCRKRLQSRLHSHVRLTHYCEKRLVLTGCVYGRTIYSMCVCDVPPFRFETQKVELSDIERQVATNICCIFCLVFP